MDSPSTSFNDSDPRFNNINYDRPPDDQEINVDLINGLIKKYDDGEFTGKKCPDFFTQFNDKKSIFNNMKNFFKKRIKSSNPTELTGLTGQRALRASVLKNLNNYLKKITIENPNHQDIPKIQFLIDKFYECSGVTGNESELNRGGRRKTRKLYKKFNKRRKTYRNKTKRRISRRN
jgi:hypothetical protein